MLKYDLNARLWTTMPSMTCKRSALSAVVFQGHIWAIGGSDGENSLDTVEIYNLAQRRFVCSYTQIYLNSLLSSSLHTYIVLDGRDRTICHMQGTSMRL